MKFPILYKQKKQDDVCPVCKRKKVWGQNEYVEFSGGSASNFKEGVCDLWLDWFSKGREDHQQDHEEVSIVCELEFPRFQIAFCSTTCLRKFLNSSVDKLEKKINARNDH